MKQQLFTFLGNDRPKHKGRFGVEIEVEGRNLPDAMKPGTAWLITGDGSLRDGKEYLFKGPRDYKDAVSALKELRDAFLDNDADLNFSFRTSVHAHINCLERTRDEVGRLLYTLVLLEPLILNMSGEERRHNRFCLSVSDAEYLVSTYHRFLHEDDYPGQGFPPVVMELNEDQDKYSSINITPLRTKGSIEIRTMRGNMNVTLLSHYLLLLDCAYDWAIKQKDVASIYEKLQRNGIESMLLEILDGKAPAVLYKYPNMEADALMQASINISLVYGL